jgi:hypothetical protein
MISDQQFDERLATIKRTYDSAREGVEAGLDQELARLFVECGWTQAKISQRMGRSHQWVSYRLLFGRFLSFSTDRGNLKSLANPLTEWRFREQWKRSGKRDKETDEERFARVWDLLEADRSETPSGYAHLVKKPGIRKAVLEAMKDGKPRSVQELAAIVQNEIPEVDNPAIKSALARIQEKPPQGQALHARHIGRSHKYKLIPAKRCHGPPVAPEIAGGIVVEVISLLKESMWALKQPEVGRQTALALENLWKSEQMLSRLLVREEVA